MKRDLAWELLLAQMPVSESTDVWLLDEHPQQLPSHWRGLVISNRYDVFQQLKTQGHNCQFSDFDLADVSGYRRFFYRVSKEKAVVHHLINQVARQLPVMGELWLAGGKGEGIKGYVSRAHQYFGGEVTRFKGSAQNQLAVLTRQQALAEPLDDQDYTRLRTIADWNDVELYSKPGVFGWNKVDLGSRLLLKALQAEVDLYGQRVLDMGCGYGLLALAAASAGAEEVVATDNNAAAILAAEATLSAYDRALVKADDCAGTVTPAFDLVLCNPPFHQGFATDGQLSQRFLTQSARLLHDRGQAWFVVNQFIGLEALAGSVFEQQRVVLQQDGFKVIVLSGPR